MKTAPSSKQRFAFVCAHSAGLNPGMLSVDLAIHSFLSRCRERDEIEADLYSVEVAREVPGPAGKSLLKYGYLQNAGQLSGYDRIIFWGDFLHSRRYHRGDLQNRIRTRAAGADHMHVYENAAALLLAAELPDNLLDRVICHGGSLTANNSSDELDTVYRQRLGRLYSGARLVALRDPVSAFAAARFTDWMRTDFLGIDNALLLQPFDGFNWRDAAPASARKRIGYSFGRSLAKNEISLQALKDFLARIETRTGYELVNIGWLKKFSDNPIGSLGDKLRAIRSCDFILTDIYHCSVNAWREGVPAICIGRGADTSSSTLNEKKKEYVFSKFNARNFYLYYENLQESGAEAKSKDIMDLLAETGLSNNILRDMETAAKAAEIRLANALGLSLAASPAAAVTA